VNYLAEVKPDAPPPSCDVCGAQMVPDRFKCLSCGASTNLLAARALIGAIEDLVRAFDELMPGLAAISVQDYKNMINRTEPQDILHAVLHPAATVDPSARAESVDQFALRWFPNNAKGIILNVGVACSFAEAYATSRLARFTEEMESLRAAQVELLAALEATLGEFESIARNTNPGYRYRQAVCFSTQTREQVKAAIRKAKGQ
jgi:hypothetical protein